MVHRWRTTARQALVMEAEWALALERPLAPSPVTAIPDALAALAGGVTKVDGEVLVNSATHESQLEPKIVALTNGGYVVVWTDWSQGVGGATGDTWGTAVKAQAFTASGAKVGGEILVNTAFRYWQEMPEVAALSGGRWVVVWSDSSAGVGGATGDPDSATKGQLFTADGTRIGGEFLVNDPGPSYQGNAKVAALANGGFAVTFTDWLGDESSDGVKVAIFGDTGAKLGPDIRVNTATAWAQRESIILALPNGGFVITWKDQSQGQGGATGDSSWLAIKAQVLTPAGAKVGGEILVNTATEFDQNYFHMAALADGFVITWMDRSLGVGGAPGDESDWAVKAQIFAFDGKKRGGEILVNTATESTQQVPQIAVLASGSFVIAWNDMSEGVGGATGDSSGNAIKLQMFDAAGARIGSEVLVNTATSGSQLTVRVTALPNGGFIVIWEDGDSVRDGDPDGSAASIRAQLFDSAGAKVGSELLVNTATQDRQWNPQVVATGGDSFVVVWEDYSRGVGGATGDTSWSAIKLQRFNALVPLAPDEFADHPADAAAPVGTLVVGQSRPGMIDLPDQDDAFGDKDVFKVHLLAGEDYRIDVTGGTLPTAVLTIRSGSSFGEVLAVSPVGHTASILFTPAAEEDFYIRVGSGGGAAGQGSYSINVTQLSGIPGPDDFADHPTDAQSSYGVGTLAVGTSRVGAIEASGDKDVFSVTLVAGHRYQIAMEPLAASGQKLEASYITIREGSSFGSIVRESGTSTLDLVAPHSGAFYIRVGSGGNGLDTGGYRISIFDRTPALIPPPDPPFATALDRAKAFIDFAADNLDGNDFSFFFRDDTWETFEAVMLALGNAEVLQLVDYAHKVLAPLALGVDFLKVDQAILASPEPWETAFIELGNLFLKTAATLIASAAGGAAGAFAGAAAGSGLMSFLFAAVGVKIGWVIGGVTGTFLYNNFLEAKVRLALDLHWDDLEEPHHGASQDGAVAAFAPSEAVGDDVVLDETKLVAFDAAWYLATYPSAAASVANGSSGSALAHFLAVGVYLGYRPNPYQQIDPDELAVALAGNPGPLGHSALLTLALGSHAGDGLSPAEAAVLNALNGARGPTDLDADARLIALAARKAGDLVANLPPSAVDRALGEADTTWARQWSNGNALAQQFRGDVEQLLGSGADDPSRYALFVVASSSGSAADVLALLNGQPAFAAALANAAFDTIGVAEHAGIWVVILADRTAGYTPGAAPPDTLAQVTSFGGEGADRLYAGARKATLNGLDGDDQLTGGASADTLNGGPGNDRLDGGAGEDSLRGGTGDDIYLIDSEWDAIVEASGEGTDEARLGGTLASFSLAALPAVERLIGNGLDNILTGNTGPNHLEGGGGNDRLDGKNGADTMAGGAGNDVFVVDNPGDAVVENAGEGIDEVRVGVGSRSDFALMYTLPAHVEVLTGISPGAQGVYGNALDNLIRMGNGGDLVVLHHGGVDTVESGGGNDFLYYGATFTAADSNDGGTGFDTVGLLGSTSVVLGAASLVRIEKLAVYSSGAVDTPFSYAITSHDSNVAAGQQLMVVAQSLLAGEALTFNGAAETNGSFNVRGGRGSDTITGGVGNDQIWGNVGADTLKGGGGADIFEYYAAAESTSAARDVILDFAPGDKIALGGIDADGSAANGDTKFAWIGGAAFSQVAGQLRATQDPTYARAWLVEGDVNGDGAADFALLVVAQAGQVLGASDFWL